MYHRKRHIKIYHQIFNQANLVLMTICVIIGFFIVVFLNSVQQEKFLSIPDVAEEEGRDIEVEFKKYVEKNKKDAL